MAAISNKKRNIIALISLLVVIVVAVIAVSIAAAPRKLDRAISTENIDYIKVVMSSPDLLLTEEVEKVEKVLTQEETKAFLQEVKESKYTIRRQACKCAEVNNVYIYYKNGNVLKFNSVDMYLYDKDGNTKKKVMFNSIDFDFDKAFVKDVKDKMQEIIEKHLKEVEMIENGELDPNDYL